MNHASICGTIIAAFMLDAMPENTVFKSRLLNDIIPGVMVWGMISYHGQSNLLRIEDNLNSNRYVHEVLQPKIVLFFQGIPGAIFQQDNARPHVAKTVRDLCSAQHMQLLP
ncbi:hypothetical protein TNCV_1635351 [Trichonephila clavipes]|nr:hypothetical protein TNCV_1635351 [Trichonephila clavipes]